MPTVRGDPVAGRPRCTFRRRREGAAVTLPPPHLQSSTPTRAVGRQQGSGPVTLCRMRTAPRLEPNVSSVWAWEAAGTSKRLREKTPLRFRTLVLSPHSPGPYPSWKLLEGHRGAVPQGNAWEPSSLPPRQLLQAPVAPQALRKRAPRKNAVPVIIRGATRHVPENHSAPD